MFAFGMGWEIDFPFSTLDRLHSGKPFTAYMKLSAEIDEDNSRLGMYRSLFYNFMSIFELKKKTALL